MTKEQKNDIFNRKVSSWRFWQDRKPQFSELEMIWNINLGMIEQNRLLKENIELLTNIK